MQTAVKKSSHGVGIGNTIFAPSQTRIFIFQDGNTDSHEISSQGVGIEKAVFTSSKRRIFIFFITGQSQKAAECRAARPAERSVHRGLGFPQQADNGQHIYVGTACKRFEKCVQSLFHFISQAVYRGLSTQKNWPPTLPPEASFCLLWQHPKPFEQPLMGLAVYMKNQMI